jgi:hypothetical protein
MWACEDDQHELWCRQTDICTDGLLTLPPKHVQDGDDDCASVFPRQQSRLNVGFFVVPQPPHHTTTLYIGVGVVRMVK